MKIKEVVVSREVANDLADGRAFYDRLQPGVGDYFWESLLNDIESLQTYAGIHSKQYGLHRMLAKRFPYMIYYYIEEDTAYVVAVLPVRRDPLWIDGQIRGRSREKE